MNLLLNFINTITMPIRYFSSWIARIVPGLKKLASISLAARVALTSFLFLLIVVTTFLVIQKYFSESGSKELWKWIAAFGLVFLLPCFVYWLVRVWSIKDVSRFPELERVWEEGVDLCRQQGIDLMQVPIFLVLGAESNDQARQTMQASQLAFPIIYPQENADIAFFANNESLFLYVPGCSALSGLATAPMQAVTVESSGPASGSSSQTPFGGTIDASMLGKGSLGPAGSANAPSQPGAGQNTGTIQADGPLVSSSAPAARPPSTGFQGTILLPENGDLSKITGGNDVSSATASRSAPVLSSKEAYEREQKLRHLCRLIVKARQNLCPINGLLTLLPFQLIESASGELQAAAQKELAVLRDELQVRCANTVMVTGLEKEVGFTELIKRVGEQRAKEFRFGKGCPVWNLPEATCLDAIAVHAVGAFEDWIYMLFQEENALKQRYNSRLFMLLCRIRGRFAQNLRAVLAKGFGFDPQIDGQLAHEQFLFSGCYFAAAGKDSSRQAFVKSVFMKSIQQEGELEWAPAARHRDAQLNAVANMFALLGTAAFVAIVVMLALKYGPSFWEA